MQRVTALIPAGNEAHQIADAIRSVIWADEVLVVVDAASTDGTQGAASEIAPNVRVVVHEFLSYASQKNWAISQASRPWIFALDADERPNAALVAGVKKILEGTPDKDAYWVSRRTHMLGRSLRFGGQGADSVIRLFRRECRYQDRPVHEEVEGYGTIGTLPGHLDHYSFGGWDQYVAKQEKYARLGAEQAHGRGRRAGRTDVIFRPLHRFVKQYLFRLGFLDGVPGAAAAYLGAYGTFLKYARLWDLDRRSREAAKT